MPPPLPFLLVSLAAAAVWTAAEIPLARETLRLLRTGGNTTLPVLACACALADLAAALVGFHWLAYDPYDGFLHLGWEQTVIPLILTVVPVGATWAIVAGLFTALVLPFPFSFAAPMGCILLLLSPFVRYGILRRAPLRHPTALSLLALSTAYLPLLPLFAVYTLHAP